MKIGAQLYTVRTFTQTEREFDTTIKQIADIGYKYVQISAIGPFSAAKVREICDKYGIGIVLTHTNPDRVMNETKAVIAEHRVMGADYIGIGSVPARYSRTEDGIDRFIKDYTPAAKAIADEGMHLMYHNHHFEFIKSGERLLLDQLTDCKELGFTLDLYWVQAGGGDPAHWLRKLAGRVDTIHFKDMTIMMGEKAEQKMAPIMEGNMNWPSIFEACKDAGVKYGFVEQDECNGEDPFDCLRISYENLVQALGGDCV